MTVVAVLVCVGVGCSKSNPLIGKWKVAPPAQPACAMFEGIEFTENTMTINILGKQSGAVTYSRDGERYLVNAPNGQIAFEKNSNGIKSVSPVECQLIPDNGSPHQPKKAGGAAIFRKWREQESPWFFCSRPNIE